MSDFLDTKLSLRQSILATLAYFDLQKYPLTLLELQRYLLRNRAELTEILNELDTLLSEQKIRAENGFYFLNQTCPPVRREENLATLRLNKYSFSAIRDWQIAKRASFLLSFIPFLRFTGVCNTLAINNVNEKSDIDFCLIANQKYLWLVRSLSVLILELARLRRHDDYIAGRICLSFYLADSNLNLSTVAKSPYDILFAYWISQFTPLWDEGIFSQLKKENYWISQLLPAYPDFFGFTPEIFSPSWFPKIVKKTGETILGLGIGRLFNLILRWLLLYRLQEFQPFYRKLYRDKDLIANDQILKFHLDDQRLSFRSRFEEKIKALGII